MPIQTPIIASRTGRYVSIISDEPLDQLARLTRELERAGVESVVQPAGSSLRAGVAYVRTIDRRLRDESAFARLAALGAKPAFLVNTPGSVRIAEWSPLAAHALRDHGICQPRRVWCLDDDDIDRAIEALGTPVVFEGVVTRQRVVAAHPADVQGAFEMAVGNHGHRGALAEEPLLDATAALSLLVVDGTTIELAGWQRSLASRRGRASAAATASRAIAALGANAMAVELAIDRRDRAYVTRIDPAPPVDRLSSEAIRALIAAIAARLEAASRPVRARTRAAGAPVAARSFQVARLEAPR
jgi:hypothetical protein